MIGIHMAIWPATPPHAAGEPGGEQLRQRTGERRQRRQQRHLRRAGLEEDREGGEIRFPGASHHRDGDAVPD
jgi:hypothetical protein